MRKIICLSKEDLRKMVSETYDVPRSAVTAVYTEEVQGSGPAAHTETTFHMEVEVYNDEGTSEL